MYVCVHAVSVVGYIVEDVSFENESEVGHQCND